MFAQKEFYECMLDEVQKREQQDKATNTATTKP